MRRADRLFAIIQLMRRNKLVRARDIAQKLEISERTVYRDIQDLIASGVPIEGEAGVGYVLKGGFDLPPLMFTEEEIEALVLGVRIVRSWADAGLAEAADDVLAKVAAVLPHRLRAYMQETPLDAPPNHWAEPISIDLAELRRAVRDRLKLSIEYRDRDGSTSHRTIRPLLMSFFGPVWTLTAWCELRDDFRSFRLDRIMKLTVGDSFRHEPGRTLNDYLRRETELFTLGRPPQRQATS